MWQSLYHSEIVRVYLSFFWYLKVSQFDLQKTDILHSNVILKWYLILISWITRVHFRRWISISEFRSVISIIHEEGILLRRPHVVIEWSCFLQASLKSLIGNTKAVLFGRLYLKPISRQAKTYPKPLFCSVMQLLQYIFSLKTFAILLYKVNFDSQIVTAVARIMWALIKLF